MTDIGFKNFVDQDRILDIIPPNSSHAKWIIKEANEGSTLINCTQGKKTESVIILNTNHVVLSALKLKSIHKKMEQSKLKFKK